MLKITNFSKSYDGKTKACDNINLEIAGGDIYGFIGHNGAGKTTLLKACAGILDFEEGEILLDGHSIRTDPIAAKKIMAYVPDNPDIYESLTGIQYLNFLGDVYGIGAAERKARVERYAGLFEIADVLHHPISSYSHGMKQKVVLIGALIHDPRILLLDEPFVGLDPKAAFLLKEVFHEMCGRGALIFFSTHILEVAEKLCNKIAIIKKGKLLTSGDTATITKDASLENIFSELN
jgi:ABC-2 type transport system ATP-binding protein